MESHNHDKLVRKFCGYVVYFKFRNNKFNAVHEHKMPLEKAFKDAFATMKHLTLKNRIVVTDGVRVYDEYWIGLNHKLSKLK